MKILKTWEYMSLSNESSLIHWCHISIQICQYLPISCNNRPYCRCDFILAECEKVFERTCMRECIGVSVQIDYRDAPAYKFDNIWLKNDGFIPLVSICSIEF